MKTVAIAAPDRLENRPAGKSGWRLILQPLGPDFLQDGGGNFFDGFGGGGQPPYAFAPHHGLGLMDFMAAIGQAGVGGVGPALIANLAQALGGNRQAKDFLAVRHQRRWQLAALKILGNQRVVGCLQAVLHGQVKRSWRFAAAAHAHQNHVRVFEVAIALTVVVGQREVDRLDPRVVGLAFGGIRKAPNPVVGLDSQFGLQGCHEHVKHVQQHAVALRLDDLQNFHVHQRRENNGPLAFQFRRVVDLANGLVRLVHAVDKGQTNMARFDLELGQDGVAKSLSGNAGAVGDEKYSAIGHDAVQGDERAQGRGLACGLYNRDNYPDFPGHAPPQALKTTTSLNAAHGQFASFLTSRSIFMSKLFEATALVVPFENLRMTDVDVVGGKNASLGEMISQLPTGPQGVRVPTGFATTAHAFRVFLAYDGLDKKINALLDALNTDDVRALAEA